ncbi:hypothetical protein [Alkalicoccus saliphilus]|jgi:hypothetical protein|uniref:hypothetical protein n=1 Tax=Alkalicoccus saliphilus TaxID=200989 RepID=UPI00135A0B56|nr:hypothetical protein [Alkalicoccus saliphilus]
MRLVIGVAIFSVTALALYLLLDLGTDVPTEVAVVAALGGGILCEWSYMAFTKNQHS